MNEQVEIMNAEVIEFPTDFEMPDGVDLPTWHSVLEVWQKVLTDGCKDKAAKVTPQWANRIVTTYPEIKYSDMVVFRDTYYGIVEELLNIVNLEIDTDDECLNAASPEEDVELNSLHYKNILIDWQKSMLLHEMEWDCLDKNAAIVIGALAEVHKATFGPQGITAYLDNVGFQFDEEDQENLAEELALLREGAQ